MTDLWGPFLEGSSSWGSLSFGRLSRSRVAPFGPVSLDLLLAGGAGAGGRLGGLLELAVERVVGCREDGHPVQDGRRHLLGADVGLIDFCITHL